MLIQSSPAAAHSGQELEACKTPFPVAVTARMFKKRQTCGVGIYSSTHVAIRPGYQLLPESICTGEDDDAERPPSPQNSHHTGCSVAAWAHGDYGQPGAMLGVLACGYGAQAGPAATECCQQLQKVLPTGKQWANLGKGKHQKALKQAFSSVQTPAALAAARGRTGALGVALYVCPSTNAVHLASTDQSYAVLGVLNGQRIQAMELPGSQEYACADIKPEIFTPRRRQGAGLETPRLMLNSFLLEPDLEYRFLLLASPELWQVMSPQEAVAWVHRYSQLQYKGVNAADALTLEAQQRQQLALQQEVQKTGGVQPLPRVADMAAVVAFFVDPLGSELLASSSSRMAPGASSAQEAELLAAAWQQHPSTHPGRLPAADLFPHLAKPHKPGFWGSVAGEELPAPEFTQGISLQLQCEELTRSQRGGSLMPRTPPSPPAASEITASSNGLPAPGSMQRQTSVGSALSSPPSARPGPGDVIVPMPSRVVPAVSLHAMVAAADEKAELEELAQLRGMVSECGSRAEGRRRGPSASMDLASGSTSVVQYMAERERLAGGGASGRASPPLHQAVRALEKKVHGRGFLRTFSSSDGDDQHSSGYWDAASGASAQPGPRPGPGSGVPSRAHSGLPVLPNGYSPRSATATATGHSPIAMQRTTSAPLLASQIDAMLGIRVRKVSPLQWQEPQGLASIQTWLSASRQASMSGDLADPLQQGSARPSLDNSTSGGMSLQPSLSLGSELRQPSWPTTTLAAANGGRDVGPSHFQLQLMHLPSGASEPRQILVSDPPKPPELQRAQSALSAGAMRLLDVAELSVSYTSHGDSHGDNALLQAAVDASEEASSVASSSMMRGGGRRSSGGPGGGGLAASASAQSLSSMGPVHRPQHPPLTRHASWGTTMSGARNMMHSLSARGSRSSQYLGAMDMGPDKRTRGQYLQPVSAVSSPPSAESNLVGPELALQQHHPSSIPEGSTLQMPEQMVSAFANVDFEALSRQYSDAPEPAVRGGRLKRYSSSAGMSIRSGGTNSRAGSVDGGDVVGSPLQQLLLLSQAGGSTLASEAASSSDNNVVAASSSPGGSGPGPGYSRHAPAPIAIGPPCARRSSSLLDMVASGRVLEETVVSEGCVRGGLAAAARSSSLAGSWPSLTGGSLLLAQGSLPGSSGSLTHRSSMETSPQASVVAGYMAADMSPQQPAKAVLPHPPALHNAGLPEAYTIRPLSHQEQQQQQERQLRDMLLQQQAQQVPGQQEDSRKAGSITCEPHVASVESNASFLLWSQQPEAGSSRPAAAAGGGRHSRSVSASSSFRLAPAGPSSETSALSSRLSAELQRSGPASGESQAGHSASASGMTGLLRAAEAADAADAADTAAAGGSNAEAIVGSPAPSKLKLSGLMYTYPQGPLSPTSSRTGTMESVSFWPQNMGR